MKRYSLSKVGPSAPLAWCYSAAMPTGVARQGFPCGNRCRHGRSCRADVRDATACFGHTIDLDTAKQVRLENIKSNRVRFGILLKKVKNKKNSPQHSGTQMLLFYLMNQLFAYRLQLKILSFFFWKHKLFAWQQKY